MTIQQIAGLGKELIAFLALFLNAFRSVRGFAMLRIYVQGLLSNIGRKNVESIALEFNKPPRNLQRFIESFKWNEEEVRDICQQLIASQHAHAEAIGCLDESGTAKSGKETVGVSRHRRLAAVAGQLRQGGQRRRGRASELQRVRLSMSARQRNLPVARVGRRCRASEEGLCAGRGGVSHQGADRLGVD